MTQEREQRLAAEEKERQDAAGEAAKALAKQAWMEARIEWNKEIHQKQRVKRRHRIREQVTG